VVLVDESVRVAAGCQGRPSCGLPIGGRLRKAMGAMSRKNPVRARRRCLFMAAGSMVRSRFTGERDWHRISGSSTGKEADTRCREVKSPCASQIPPPIHEENPA